MKKRALTIFLIALMCTLGIVVGAPTTVFAANLSANPIILLETGEIEEGYFTVTATLAKNSGIASVLLSLDYNFDAMTLVEYTPGTALGTLSCQPSGNLATKPFNVLYSLQNPANDFSTGELAKFKFQIKANAPEGTYQITFTSERNKVQYFVVGENDELSLANKSIVSQTASVTIAQDEIPVVDLSPVPEEFYQDDEPADDTWKIIVIAVAICVVCIGLIVLAIFWILKRGSSSQKK